MKALVILKPPADKGDRQAILDGTTRGNKGRFGRLAYFTTAFLKVIASRPRYLEVDVDGISHSYRAVEVSVMNCGLIAQRFYPGGSDIRIDDGHLAVWILSMKNAWDYLRYAAHVAIGRTRNPDADFISAEKIVSISSSAPLPVQADGDRLPALHSTGRTGQGGVHSAR